MDIKNRRPAACTGFLFILADEPSNQALTKEGTPAYGTVTVYPV